MPPSRHPEPCTQAEQPIDFSPYQGPKRKVQVVQINIPADDIKRYPELRDKRVGFGNEQHPRRNPL